MYSIIELLHNFERRNIQWQTMRTILQLCELSPSRGWEETRLKLDRDINQKDFDYSTNLQKLETSYRNHLLTGQKAVKIFKVDSTKLISLCKTLRLYNKPKNIYDDTYPFPLSKSRQEEVDSIPKLSEIKTIGENLSLVFCTKRNVSETVKLDPSELGIDKDSYDEIIGKRKYTDQFFDVVFLRPESGLVEIRIDIRNGISMEDRQYSFDEIRKASNSLFASLHENVTLPLSGVLNIFPAIDKLYRSTEGKVGEISFKTDSGSTKNEKMRRSHEDLREEIYHHAGRTALEEAKSDIQLYKIAILLEFEFSEDIQSKPELFLPGRKVQLSKITPELEEFLIKKCCGLDDYEFVFNKIVSYSTNCGE